MRLSSSGLPQGEYFVGVFGSSGFVHEREDLICLMTSVAEVLKVKVRSLLGSPSASGTWNVLHKPPWSSGPDRFHSDVAPGITNPGGQAGQASASESGDG